VSNKSRTFEIQIYKIPALICSSTKDKELFINARDYLNQSALLKLKRTDDNGLLKIKQTVIELARNLTDDNIPFVIIQIQ